MRDPLVPLWPKGVISIQDVEVQFERPAFSGPDPLVGRPQVVVSPAAGWRITYHGALAHRGNVQTFRAVLAKHHGRAQPIYVSPYDGLNGPVQRAAATSPILYTFTGGYIFSTGYRFASSIQDCVLDDDAAIGATEILVANSAIAPLSPGDYFELDGRLHVIEDIVGTTWSIWPGLRADYASGTVLEIADPRMKAYLDLSSAPALRLQYGHWGQASLSFVEAGW